VDIKTGEPRNDDDVFILALVEHQTEEELTLSFNDPDCGAERVLLDIEKIAATPDITNGSTVKLKRVCRNGEIHYILLAQTVLPPDPADNVLTDLDLMFPSPPDDYDDPQQLKRYKNELKKAFEE